VLIYNDTIMKNPSFLLLAAALLAAPLSAQNWSDGAPVIEAQTALRPPSGGNVAGQFDSYTFTMSWEPTFCEGKPGAQECASQRPDRFDASNLALHGLWPDKNGDASHSYGYCGVSSSDQSLDRAPTWCQLREPAYSDATHAALGIVMPGVNSCLDHHEWTKHGTCSGLTADQYFASAAALIQQVAASSFGQYLKAHAGQTVDSSAVVAAFEQDFGVGSGAKLVLNCTSVRGSSALLEARLHLPTPLQPASQLAAMLLSTGDRGNCPSSFLLDPIPSH
jgi:ribonuclease T2